MQHAILKDTKTLIISKVNDNQNVYYRVRDVSQNEAVVELFDSWTFDWHEIHMQGNKTELLQRVTKQLKELGHNFKIERF